METEAVEQEGFDAKGKKLLIFIVAYNAETTIDKVLARIPSSLHGDNVEVLIMMMLRRTTHSEKDYMGSEAPRLRSRFCGRL